MKKILLIGLVSLFAVSGLFAQVSFVQPLRAGASGADVLSDSVSSTGTAFLTSPVIKGPYAYVTVEVTVTKISGTVGGTISLLGAVSTSASYTSASATTFCALKTLETQTAVATITAADASAVYHWRLYGNPFARYRVTWTGSSGQLASFTARVIGR